MDPDDYFDLPEEEDEADRQRAEDSNRAAHTFDADTVAADSLSSYQDF